ncbi:MAG TPA: PQQ-binding-like beta-propeller repeat protein [Pyrinomonadaceae bacterium]
MPEGLAKAAPGVDGQLSLSQPLTVRWQYESEHTVNLTPATDGERIYLPLAEGSLVSLRAIDGQLFWRTEIGGELSASPVADDGAVYIASKTVGVPDNRPSAMGALRALGREAGVTLWMRTFRFPLQGTLAVNQTTLFGGGSDGRVYALDKRSGKFVWVMQHWSPFASRLVISGSRLYIGNDDGTLFSLDQATGKQTWRYRTQGAVRGRVAVVDGVVYFGSADGYVYALDEMSGRLRWRARTGAGVQAVAGVPGGLLVASLDNFVYLLSLNRGDRLWKRQLAGRLAAEPLTAPDGALFTPLSGDTGVVLDLRDGKQLNSLPIGEDNSTTASPIVAGNMLFVTTRHGLLAFSRPVEATNSKAQRE